MSRAPCAEDSERLQTGDDGGRGVAAGAQSAPAARVVAFRLADDVYGVEIAHTLEVIMPGPVTRLPEAPGYVRGLMNHCGRITPIIDLRLRLGLSPRPDDAQTRIIIVDAAGAPVGVVVDAIDGIVPIEGIVSIAEAVIDPPAASGAGIDPACLRGAARLNDRSLMLLDIEGVCANADGAEFGLNP